LLKGVQWRIYKFGISERGLLDYSPYPDFKKKGLLNIMRATVMNVNRIAGEYQFVIRGQLPDSYLLVRARDEESRQAWLNALEDHGAKILSSVKEGSVLENGIKENERWCILYPSKIQLFHERKADSPQLEVPLLKNSELKKEEQKDGLTLFRLTGTLGTSCAFTACNAEEEKDWAAKLNSVMQLKSSPKVTIEILEGRNFPKVEKIFCRVMLIKTDRLGHITEQRDEMYSTEIGKVAENQKDLTFANASFTFKHKVGDKGKFLIKIKQNGITGAGSSLGQIIVPYDASLRLDRDPEWFLVDKRSAQIPYSSNTRLSVTGRQSVSQPPTPTKGQYTGRASMPTTPSLLSGRPSSPNAPGIYQPQSPTTPTTPTTTTTTTTTTTESKESKVDSISPPTSPTRSPRLSINAIRKSISLGVFRPMTSAELLVSIKYHIPSGYEPHRPVLSDGSLAHR